MVEVRKLRVFAGGAAKGPIRSFRDFPVRVTIVKFEVTREMYLAVSQALEPYYLDQGIFDSREDRLAAIFRAMSQALKISELPCRQISE